jgi:non-specific serine/threonine protein kinase
MPPTILSSFVGRKEQGRQLKELVRTKRLVTLVGVGGVGKTRLATRVASQVAAEFTAGTRFVDLASVDHPSLVPRAVVLAIGALEEAETPVQQTLAEFFRAGRWLLILDNCEHLTYAAAELATALLEECPLLSVLATSREPLRCEGENVYQVPPLALPAFGDPLSLADVARSEAGQLFLDRALAAAGFRPDEHSAMDIAAVCERLDGIPLALELGAALLRTVTVRQLASMAADSLYAFQGGSRLAPPRQQTLEAAIDWSYRLLARPERQVFERLALFSGGFSLDAANAVCADEDITSAEVLPILTALVDRSLLVPESTIEPGPRFRLLETVRQFARSRLDSRQQRVVVQRHATHFLTLAETTFERARASQPHVWYERLLLDQNNLRLALRHFEACDSERLLRLAGAMWQFWKRTGAYHEGAAWLEMALSSGATGTARQRAMALCGLVELHWPAGHFAGIEDHSNESLRLARQADDAWLTALSLFHLAIPAVRTGDIGEAVALVEESAALARTTRDLWLITYMINAVGVCLLRGGDLTRAREHFEEALSCARAAGDDLMAAYQLGSLGAVARAEGNLDRAEEFWADCLRVAVPRADWRLVANQLLRMAEVAFQRRRLTRAGRLLGAGEGLYERLRLAYEFPMPELDPVREAARGEPVMRAREQGRRMPVQKIVDEILNSSDDVRATRARRDGPLTPRETEVAALVAEGWSNREIAERLVITERTAENHVSHIMEKLAVVSRAHVARHFQGD